jgi:hypothetical protein
MLSEWLFARDHPAYEVNRVGRVFHGHLPIDRHAGVEVKVQRKHRSQEYGQYSFGRAPRIRTVNCRTVPKPTN